MKKLIKVLIFSAILLLFLTLGGNAVKAANITSCEEKCAGSGSLYFPVYECVDLDNLGAIEGFYALDDFEKSYYDSSSKQCYYDRTLKDLTEYDIVFVSKSDRENEGDLCGDKICLCSKKSSCDITNDEATEQKSCLDEGCVSCSKTNRSCDVDEDCCQYPRESKCGESGACYRVYIAGTVGLYSRCYTNENCASGVCDYERKADGSYVKVNPKPGDVKYCYDGPGYVPEEDEEGENGGEEGGSDGDGGSSVGLKGLGEACSSDSECDDGYCELAEGRLKICVACRKNRESCTSSRECCEGLICKSSDKKCHPSNYIAPESGTCDYYCEDPETRQPPEGSVCICNPLPSQTLEEVIDNLIDFIFSISIVVAPLMIVWAGGLYITSAGSEDKIKTAKNIIVYALSGLAVVLLAKGLVAIIIQILGG